MGVIIIPHNAGAHETLAPTSSTGITGTVIQPTSGDYKGLQAEEALITVEDNTINFTLDGTVPTAKAGTNKGHQADAGLSYLVQGAQSVRQFRCIDRVAGSTSAVKITTFF